MRTPDGRIVRPVGFSQFKGSHWFCGDDRRDGCGRRWCGSEEGKDWVRGLNDLYALCRYCEGIEETRSPDEDTDPGWSLFKHTGTADMRVGLICSCDLCRWANG